MGVHGLWKLLEPSGKPVPVETLENHVLAVDVSIWLHQLLQGYRDSGGSSLPNAHLLGLFQRVCKLLFFRIKPVFVFDGGVPALKRKTIASRHQQKDKATIASEKARQQLLKNLLKQKAISQVLGELNAVPSTSTSSSQEKKDLYELPPIDNEDDNSDLESVHDSYSSESEEDLKKNKKYKDLHSIDVHSSEFKALPADIRHDILSELKEKRKENSWGRIHEMPEDLGQFSSFQMNRLLKRRSVQVSLQEAEKEMGGRTLSLGDVEALLSEQGIQTSSGVGNRIASDNVTRFLYITDPSKTSEKIVPEDNPKKDDDSKPVEENHHKDEKSECTISAFKNYKCVTVPEENNKPSANESLNIVKKEFSELPTIKENEIEVSDESSDEITFEDLNEEFELNRKLIIENSGLTQDQILSIIKEQNKKSIDIVGNVGGEIKNSMVEITDSFVKSEIITPSLHDTNRQGINFRKAEKNHTLLVNNGDNLQSNNLNLIDDQSITSKSEHKQLKVTSAEGLTTEDTRLIDNLVFNNHGSSGDETKQKSDEDNVVCFMDKKCINKSDLKCHCSTDNDSGNEIIEADQTSKENNLVPVVESTDSSVFQVTINTQKNVEANDEDIFADIFDDVADNGKVGINLEKITDVDSDGDHNVAIMSSSDTSASENEDDKNSIFENVTFVTDEDNSNSVTHLSNTCEYFRSKNVEPDKEHKLKNENTDESDFQNLEELKTGENSEPLDPVVPLRKPVKKLSTKELNKLQTILENQESDLVQKQGKEERLASTVTEQMRLEAQELLQLFGVPWVMAPMEAEAQCAFMDRLGLTQGTITDDSDVWLFGARKVYKNFFNQKKFVLQFQAQDIHHYFKLSRGDLIELALLVGSDYTVGVTGVGPVTALEILAMFRPSSSSDANILTTLTAFKNWLQHPNNSSSPLARKLKDVHLEEGFPNKDVVEAYLHPLVDESEESFSWGFPDLDGLREFAKRKFGWNQARTDELILPIVKNLSQKTSQSKIDTFFHIKPAIPVYKDKVSHRVQKAIHRLGGESSSILKQFECTASASSQKLQRSRGGSQIRKASSRGRGATLQIEPPPPSKPLPFPTNEELIPQRERDRLEALKRKIKAIEVMKAKRSKKDKRRPPKAHIKEEANLSESSSDEN